MYVEGACDAGSTRRLGLKFHYFWYMLHALKNHLETNFLELQDSTSILAISGGVDSVVLAHLLHKLDYRFVLAHCNFKLRGAESDDDAVFVQNLAEKLGIPVFIQDFNTLRFAEDHKLSTQMAARELRYAWFEELRREQNAAYVLTAHHANDALETFLINLSRGSGIDGLQGIPARNGPILRPLLPFLREEIAHFAEENKLEWREDASNASDKYLRNHLRHHAIPALQKAAPDFLGSFSKSLKYLQDSAALVDDYISLLYPKIVTQTFKGFQLNIAQLKQLPNTNAVLYELLKDFGFTAWEDIYALPNAQSGKNVLSPTHQLVKNRNFLVLTKNEEQKPERLLIKENDELIAFDQKILSVEKVNKMGDFGPKTAVFDVEQLHFPLTLRNWEEGDYFYPFGMQGKKKLSKYFKDEKFSILEKKEVKVLCNGNEIIWIVGHRSDERYRVQQGAKSLLKFMVNEV